MQTNLRPARNSNSCRNQIRFGFSIQEPDSNSVRFARRRPARMRTRPDSAQIAFPGSGFGSAAGPAQAPPPGGLRGRDPRPRGLSLLSGSVDLSVDLMIRRDLDLSGSQTGSQWISHEIRPSCLRGVTRFQVRPSPSVYAGHARGARGILDSGHDIGSRARSGFARPGVPPANTAEMSNRLVVPVPCPFTAPTAALPQHSIEHLLVVHSAKQP